jgi:bifunctional non-homologous end joining protein LigD
MLSHDEASLVYLINLGCIDLNPWNSTVDHPDKPDYLIIDLDPEAVSFEKVVNVALEVRKVLEKLEIPSFPKTSGARGMHIYIPMGAKYTYEQVRFFAELLCTQVNQKIPDLTSMIRDPKKRQGKVYLDFLQNARGQTLASVYSARPKPGAPVSTPLKWSEVTSKLHPSQFTIKNIPKRIQSHGDIFKEVLGKGINIEKILKKLEDR